MATLPADAEGSIGLVDEWRDERWVLGRADLHCCTEQIWSLGSLQRWC